MIRLRSSLLALAMMTGGLSLPCSGSEPANSPPPEDKEKDLERIAAAKSKQDRKAAKRKRRG